MLLFLPIRLLRIALIGPRLLVGAMLHSPFRSIRMAIILFGLAALVTFLTQRNKTNVGT